MLHVGLLAENDLWRLLVARALLAFLTLAIGLLGGVWSAPAASSKLRERRSYLYEGKTAGDFLTLAIVDHTDWVILRRLPRGITASRSLA